jgi:hypothetical protein
MHSRSERVVWVYVKYWTSIGVDKKLEIGKKAHISSNVTREAAMMS